MRKMMSGLLVLVVITWLLLPNFAIMAQADEPAILQLTIGQVLTVAAMGLSFLVSSAALIVAFVKSPSAAGARALDEGIALRIDAARQNREFIEAMEKLVSGMTVAHQTALREVAEITLKAAQWTPARADDEAAKLARDILNPSADDEGVALTARLDAIDARLDEKLKALEATAKTGAE